MVQQCGGTGERFCATVFWNSGTVMVEQCWWNSVVERWNSDSGTVMVEQCWWKSEKVTVEQWNGDGEAVWWNSGTVTVEQCGRTLEQ